MFLEPKAPELDRQAASADPQIQSGIAVHGGWDREKRNQYVLSSVLRS